MSWKVLKEEAPITYRSGNWDGLCSDLVLVSDGKEKFEVAELNHGFMDGAEFNFWYDAKGFELDFNPTHWMKIPNVY
jgi:hypothetical protein